MKQSWTSIWEDIKQLRYPGEFRISQSAWPSEILEELESAARMIQSLSGEKEKVSEASEDIERLVLGVGNGLWRARKKLLAMDENDASQELRVAVWALESAWDIMCQAGVEVQEHDGDIITGGEALHVLAIEPSEQCSRETVIETLKPTIYYQTRMIQAGEIIVGTPVKSTTEESES